MKTLSQLAFGYNHKSDNQEEYLSIEKMLRSKSLLKDRIGYKGNNDTRVTCCFTKWGVYTILTNGLGVNSDKGGMFSTRGFHRNSNGIKPKLYKAQAYTLKS